MHRLARFTFRFRIAILAVTALFIVAAGVFGGGAAGVLKTGGFDVTGSESVRARAMLVDNFGGGDPGLVLLLTAAGGDVDDPALATAGADIAERLAAIDGVGQVASYWSLGNAPSLRSADGDAALVLAWIPGDEDEVGPRVETITAALAGQQGPFDVRVGGREAVFVDLTHVIEDDLIRAELIAIPLTLLLLVFVFRGLVAASLPLLVGAIAILGTLLNLFVIGSITDVSIYAINLATALGLGLGIDYSLLLVSRFRDELAAGHAVEVAITRTLATAGKTVLISALTVAVSLSALLVFPLYYLRSFAYAGVAVVLLALAGSLLTLPALFAVLGRRVNSVAIGRSSATRAEDGEAWSRLAIGVMRRPLPIAIAAVALLVLLGAPFRHVAFGTPDDRVLPASASSRQVADVLRADFDGNSAESFGVVADGLAPDRVDDIAASASLLSALPGVARVDSAAGTFVAGARVATGNGDRRFVPSSGAAMTWFSVVPSFPLVSAEGQALVTTIRGLDLPFNPLMEGEAAALIDRKAALADAMPIAALIIVVATFVLIFMLSGSILVPIKALVLNVLSLSATFGAMVWIFQDGNLSGLLGFTATGAIDISMPILMFCVAFGLSMDYEIFLLSRIKEEYDRTRDNQGAIALGIARTGRIVTAAALLLSVTFFAFGTSNVSFLKMFGIGLGIAVIMDATIVRGLLVPAFMRLAGDANWWAPAPLRRFHDRFGLRESDSPGA